MRPVRTLAADCHGGALVEFALIFPFMVLLLFGVMQFVDGFDSKRRVEHVAYAVADLVAQSKTVSGTDLQNYMAGGQTLIAPLPLGDLGQRVASFTADSNGVVSLDWSSSRGTYAGSKALSLPAGYLKPNQSAVVADVSYSYTPIAKFILPSTILFESRALLRPRVTDRVSLTP